jgi:hydrogenase maturation protease
MTARAAVLGLGNVLMGDDGFGPYLVRVLEAEWSLPPGVAVHDLGTPGLDLAPWLTGLELAVIVDTVGARGRPGDVRTYARSDLLRHAAGPRLSPHDPGLREALLTAELAGCAPRDLWVVGVIPEHVRMGPGLSPAVRASIREATAEVVRLLDEHGFAPARRRAPRPPDIWWSARPAPRS